MNFLPSRLADTKTLLLYYNLHEIEDAIAAVLLAAQAGHVVTPV